MGSFEPKQSILDIEDYEKQLLQDERKRIPPMQAKVDEFTFVAYDTEGRVYLWQPRLGKAILLMPEAVKALDAFLHPRVDTGRDDCPSG